MHFKGNMEPNILSFIGQNIKSAVRNFTMCSKKTQYWNY